MNTINKYIEVSELPHRADHLWRYTPWKKVHPTGKVKDVPKEVKGPKIRLLNLSGTESPPGIELIRGVGEDIRLPESDDVSTNFIKSISEDSKWILKTESKFNSNEPILIEIDAVDEINGIQLTLDIGDRCEFEIVTIIKGSTNWMGLLRTGRIGNGSNINDITVGLQERGTLLRVDAISLGRDAEFRTGTVSSGSERTKADLRYRMGEIGSNLRVIGSILSRDSMHLDHHIEIQHDAPQTFSRLSWNAACGGKSKTIGTGMLKVANGSKGADASQNFHNLLLSKDAEADGIPELEVLENEVVGCGHGIANGPIDENQLFYLHARGFSPMDAKSALIAAFLNSTLSKMGSMKVHDWLSKMLYSELKNMNAE
ncbi:SufD family Fe-S cluster assembly protein [Euryarchaeota archaeon]|nr:SufD family Fe-S cluster assembly protein [Euryarchaeota archaeon]|tara:strand:+ start:48146 stop:49258 length:1113 start_codon:yes stop_codon:yes gene_type:complete